ncbi:RNA-directed DNA polymerase from mobile element jockey [Frankliniella fusca]|uniref:RNA-directed DNA polymerase from mobile element jockey n=1 Tax=Frankliniella fusca TaxID=407009 RepID=A0AAE1HKL2_9NEOP|nr:RNA-directed DNA polymerase from mobile element jockey [Frankliniella fusca]
MDGEVIKQCAKCKGNLKIGVFCVNCKSWIHNKCEKLEPGQRTGYVCKTCISVINFHKNSSDNSESTDETFENKRNKHNREKLDLDHTLQLYKQISALEATNMELTLKVQQLEREIETHRCCVPVAPDETRSDQALKNKGKSDSQHVKNKYVNQNKSNLSKVATSLVNKQETTALKASRDIDGRNVNTNTVNRSILDKSKNQCLDDSSVSKFFQDSARNKQLLVLSDSHGRKMSAKLSDKLGENYNVTGIVKPGAPISEITKDVETLTENFAMEDCVLIVAGTNVMSSDRAEEEIDNLIHTALNLSERTKSCSSELTKEQISVIDGFYCGAIYFRKISRGGGSAIFVKNSVKSIEFKVTDLLVEGVFEASIVLLKTVTIICVYKPPYSCDDLFLENLQECINRLVNKRKYIFICGDLNIDVLGKDKKKWKAKQGLIDLMEQNGLYTTTDKATRKASETAIDHIITNAPKNIIQSVCDIEVGISDHFMQSIMINLVRPNDKIEKQFEYKRKLGPRQITAFQFMLEQVNWEEVYNATSVDDKFHSFHSKFKYLYDECFPKKRVLVKEEENKSWVTRGIKTTSSNFRALCKQSKVDKDSDFQQYFSKYKSLYRKLIRTAKSLSIKSQIESSNNKQKTVWSIINKSRGKIKEEHKNIEIMDEDNTLHSDPEVVVEAFNKYYCTIASQLQEKNNNSGTNVKIPVNFSMYLSPVTDNDVILAISKLKNKYCCGYDDIFDNVVKKCHTGIIRPLSHVINASFSEGIFPEALKISKVMPLYKGKGEPTSLSNYRPVANISVFAKIFEIVMEGKVRKYLYKFGILSRSQYGFIKDKNTTDAIVDFIDFTYEALDSKNFTCGLFFDMTKAFDLVDHDIVLMKLESYGIRGLWARTLRSVIWICDTEV